MPVRHDLLTANTRTSQEMNPQETIAPWKTYRRLWIFLHPYAGRMAAVLFVSLISTAMGLVQPYLSKLLIDNALMRRDLYALGWIAGIMLSASVLGYALNIFASYTYVKLSASMLFDMRVALFRHLQTLSPRFYARFRMGDLMSRLNTDVGEVQRVSADTLLSVLGNVVFFAGCAGMMLWLNWRLFLLGFVFVPAALASFLNYQRRLTVLTKQLREHGADLSSIFMDSILGLRTIVSLGAGGREVERFRGSNDSWLRAMLRVQITSFLTGAVPGTILTVSASAVFLYGGWLIIRDRMTIGTLVAFMAYQMRLLSPVQTLMGMTAGLASARVSLARIFELFDTPAEVREKSGPTHLLKVRQSIRLESVSLQFERSPVLINVNVEITAGSFCAVLGPSGVGKSTLADLIVRYLDPDEGRVLVDGRDLREFALSDVRSQIMLVDQIPYLFNCSIRENIAFGMPAVSGSQIEAAASAAGLDELMRRLPNGLDTACGERGLALSAGERQRIALARAFLRRPTVLILDEPTSALDADMENAIASGLRRALSGTTFIVITHRPALAEHADVLIRIRDGRAEMSHGVRPAAGV